MRVTVLRLALLLLPLALQAVPALARDDLMPPPKKSPRIPVEAKVLDDPAPRPAEKQEYEGAGKAVDGERLNVAGQEVRLFGIITPSLVSSYGPHARLSLDRMLSGTTVLCKATGHDREGHLLAFCGTVKVPDLSFEMLRQGWAMVDRRALKGNTLSGVYERAEQEAQANGRGIFAPTPMAMAVPVSNPGKAAMVPMPEGDETKALPESVAASPASGAKDKNIAPLPDIPSALQRLSAAAAPVRTSNNAQAPMAVSETAGPGGFLERYQILSGAVLFLVTACVFAFALMWREKKVLAEKRRALAAALRGELMSARMICRTRARDLMRAKDGDDPRAPSQLWPRTRSFVYQAHVGSLGLLGAELARQVASVYGQCADYASYYQNASPRHVAAPRVVAETLASLAEHMDTLMQGLQEVETTGRALIGEDIMAEDEARAAAENVRLAVAAADKRALPAPRAGIGDILTRKGPRQSPAVKKSGDDGEETPDNEETGEASSAEASEKPETDRAA